MGTKITSNKAKCLICGDILESRHRHDYVVCSCKNLAIDGGRDYCKRNCADPSQMEELSEGVVEELSGLAEYRKKQDEIRRNLFLFDATSTLATTIDVLSKYGHGLATESDVISAIGALSVTLNEMKEEFEEDY